MRETEAEAVAFVVYSAVQLETASASQDCIGLYHGDADTLLESLRHVQQVANRILSFLPGNADGSAEAIGVDVPI